MNHKSNINKIITIGRDVNNDICINKPQVSLFHAKFIIQSPDNIIMQDLESTNGTYVNNVKITSSEVTMNDRIDLGSFRFDMKLLENKLYDDEESVPDYSLPNDDYQDENYQVDNYQEIESPPDKKKTPKLVNIKLILIFIAIIALGSFAYNKVIEYNQNKGSKTQNNQTVSQTAQDPAKKGSSTNSSQQSSSQKSGNVNQSAGNQQNMSNKYPLVSDKNGIIQCGETLQGRIDSSGYLETIKFNAQSGEKIAIAVSRLSDNTPFFPCWKLIAPSQQAIKVNHKEWFCSCNQDYSLDQTGQYTIKIIDKKQVYTGDYAIRLEPVSATFNGSISPAPDIECGVTKKGTIELKNAIDSYTFSGRSGEKIAIAATKKSISALFNPCWQLIAPSGEIIKYGYKYKICSGNTDYILPFDGLYTIRVFDKDHNGTGEYHVRLEPVSAFLNGTKSCATQLTQGELIIGNIEEPNASSAFVFDKKNDRALINVTKKSTTASFRPCWSLYSASGEIIKTGYKNHLCSGQGSYTLKSDGPFVIRVWDKELDSSGEFSIIVK